MEAIPLNYQFFHQNESCSSKSGLVKIIIWLDKLIRNFFEKFLKCLNIEFAQTIIPPSFSTNLIFLSIHADLHSEILNIQKSDVQSSYSPNFVPQEDKKILKMAKTPKKFLKLLKTKIIKFL